MAQQASLPEKKTETVVEGGKAKKTAKAKPVVKDLRTLKLELRNLILDTRSGKEKNTTKLRGLRKEIARFLTKQNQTEK